MKSNRMIKMNNIGTIKLMKKLKNILLFIFMCYGINSFAQKADDIIGKYHLPNKLDVEIVKDNGKYYGKIIALNGYENGRTKDVKNPDKSKRNDLLLNKIILKDLEFDNQKKTWINGQMYAPEKGMIVNLTITKIRDKEIEVVGSKYFFWRTLIWEKL